MEPEKKNTNAIPGILDFIGGVVIGLSVLAGIFFLIYSNRPKPKTTPTQPTTMTQPTIQTPTVPAVQATAQPAAAKVVQVQTCSLKKETSSLVDKLTVFSNGLSGTFRGVATKVSYTNTNQLAVLELLSLDKKDTTTFDVQAANATLMQLTKSPIEVSKGLHPGSPIIVGFKCAPRYGNKFVITLIETAAN